MALEIDVSSKTQEHTNISQNLHQKMLIYHFLWWMIFGGHERKSHNTNMNKSPLKKLHFRVKSHYNILLWTSMEFFLG
jgi:hypothetical protein